MLMNGIEKPFIIFFYKILNNITLFQLLYIDRYCCNEKIIYILKYEMTTKDRTLIKFYNT